MGFFCGVVNSRFLHLHSWPLAWPLGHNFLTEDVVFREELEISNKPKPKHVLIMSHLELFTYLLTEHWFEQRVILRRQLIIWCPKGANEVSKFQFRVSSLWLGHSKKCLEMQKSLNQNDVLIRFLLEMLLMPWPFRVLYGPSLNRAACDFETATDNLVSHRSKWIQRVSVSRFFP